MLSIEEEGERREVERGERQAVLQTYQGGGGGRYGQRVSCGE